MDIEILYHIDLFDFMFWFCKGCLLLGLTLLVCLLFVGAVAKLKGEK